MNSLSPAEIREMLPALLNEIDSASNVWIGTHINPDGDALGTALALAEAVRQRGKPVSVCCHHETPRYLKFLPGEGLLSRVPSGEADLAIVVDLEALDRLGPLKQVFEQARRLVVIDHHQPHESPGDLRIVAEMSSATALILTDLFRDSEVKITPDMATCLMTGLVTDTGSFRFNNTTSHALHVAGELLELGADLKLVAEHVYMTKSLPSARLLGTALANMMLAENDRIAWTTLPGEAFAATGAKEEDTEGFVNELLAIETVQIAALLRHAASGRVKISLRSRGEIDVTTVARQFGGGGHKNAAGASDDGPIEDTAARLVASMKACLASS